MDNVSYSDNIHSYDEELITDGPQFKYIAVGACFVFILVGIPGNLITIIALTKCKKVRNATAVFIINLSTSDLLFCSILMPITLATFWHKKWIFGDAICKMFAFLRYVFIAVSLLTILTISINRYILIAHPRSYQRIYKRKFLSLMIFATWFIPIFILLFPLMQVWGDLGYDTSISSCSIIRDKLGRSPKEFLFIIAFLIPCLAILICYARIFYVVRKATMKTQEPARTGSIKINNLPGDKIVIRTISAPNFDIVQRAIHDESYDPSNFLDLEHFSAESTTDNNNINGDNNQRKYLSKSNEMKFIDTSVDSDLPPTLSTLRNDNVKVILDYSSLNIINCNASKTVEFSQEDDDIQIKQNSFKTGRKPSKKPSKRNGYDKNNSDNKEASRQSNNFRNSAFELERSSSSGADVPPYDRNSLINITSARKQNPSTNRHSNHLRRFKNDQKRKSLITSNTSGASIMYPGNMTAKDKRLLKMILVIFLTYNICYLPITLVKLFRLDQFKFINLVSYILIFMTTCINPIIYVVMSSEYRQAYWTLLTCRTSQAKNINKDRKMKHSNRPAV